jgi:hypothetical protein
MEEKTAAAKSSMNLPRSLWLEHTVLGLLGAVFSFLPLVYFFAFLVFGLIAQTYPPHNGEAEDLMGLYLCAVPIAVVGPLLGYGLGRWSYCKIFKGKRLLADAFAIGGGVLASIILEGLLVTLVLNSRYR